MSGEMSDEIPLKPITPLQSTRYQKSTQHDPHSLHTTSSPSVEMGHRQIEPGMFMGTSEALPGYLPAGWGKYIHPDGFPYIYKNSAGTPELNIVADGCLPQTKPETPENPEDAKKEFDYKEGCEYADRYSKQIKEKLENRKIPLSSSYELYLELNEQQGGCGYYIVDHSRRTIFWPDPIESTEELGMSTSFSQEHLRYAFEDLYWMHVEYYPAHPNIPTESVVDGLINALTNGRGDALTSNNSTFPYSAEDCAKFIKLIKPYQTMPIDSGVMRFIARLNSFLASNKFIHHFGQRHCRLSRDQCITHVEPARTYRPLSILSMILFGVPASFTDGLDRVFHDSMVYTSDFQEFFANCQEDRRMFVNLSSCAMLVHFGLLATSFGSSVLSSLGLFSGLISVASGVTLYSQHRELPKCAADQGQAYLIERRHDTYGFRYLALIFSLPRATFLWSIALLVPQVLFILYGSIGMTYLTALVFFSAWFALVFQYKLVPAPFHWLPSRNTSEGETELDGVAAMA